MLSRWFYRHATNMKEIPSNVTENRQVNPLRDAFSVYLGSQNATCGAEGTRRRDCHELRMLLLVSMDALQRC